MFEVDCTISSRWIALVHRSRLQQIWRRVAAPAWCGLRGLRIDCGLLDLGLWTKNQVDLDQYSCDVVLAEFFDKEDSVADLVE